jgi:hypothetical protein
MNKNLARTWLIGLLFLLLTASFDGYSVDAFLATTTRTPTPPTRTPTRVLTKALSTPTPYADSFYRLLSWGGGGGGGGSYKSICADLDIPKITPAVLGFADTAQDYGYLCLYGIKPDNQITITFKSPNGKADAVGVFKSGAPPSWIYQTKLLSGHIAIGYIDNYALTPKIIIAEIKFWKPLGIPEGIWDVTVKSDRNFLKTRMNVGWPKTDPRLEWVYPQNSLLNFAPLIIENGHHKSCQVANSEEVKAIQAINLEPNHYYSIGIYTYPDHSMEVKLNRVTTILTDKYGKYQTSFFAKQRNSPETYVIALLRPDSEMQGSHDGELGLVRVSYAYACIRVKWKACLSAPYSSLEKGNYVTVNFLNPIPNNIRDKPGLKNKLLGSLQIDETATIIDGPQCADNMVWWKIKTYSGITGWTGEGQGSEVWLVP